MILVVCTDDPSLIAVAKKSAEEHPEVFGKVYVIYKDQLPTLGSGENLFIIAHGAYKGDGNNPVIGDEHKAFYVNGVELWLNIKSVVPQNYSASVYIDACESADHNAYTFSFAEVFKSQIDAQRPDLEAVYGRNGSVGGLIPLPTASGWKKA